MQSHPYAHEAEVWRIVALYFFSHRHNDPSRYAHHCRCAREAIREVRDAETQMKADADRCCARA